MILGRMMLGGSPIRRAYLGSVLVLDDTTTEPLLSRTTSRPSPRPDP